MDVFAISDLHVGFEDNWRALTALPPRPDAALILAGDIGESAAQLASTLDLLRPRFRKLMWCPGNHELWQHGAKELRGEAKYQQLVELCRARDVLTPEDDYPIWSIRGERFLVAPLFLLYDYTFKPEHVSVESAVDWAAEAGLRCADEDLLHPDPYPSRAAWCRVRCELSAARLERSQRACGLRTILVNHFPLKRCLAQPPAIPRFQIWSGTRRTEDWHLRFRAAVAISGHLHFRSSRILDGCRFEEVSLGYPRRQWRASRGLEHYLRPIVPPAAGDERITV